MWRVKTRKRKTCCAPGSVPPIHLCLLQPSGHYSWVQHCYAHFRDDETKALRIDGGSSDEDLFPLFLKDSILSM